MGELDTRDSNISLGPSVVPKQSVHGAKSHLPAIFLTTFFVVALILIIATAMHGRHGQVLWNAEQLLNAQASLAGARIDQRLQATLLSAQSIAQSVNRADTVPINLDSYFTALKPSAPWVSGLALVASDLGASTYAGMPPPGLSEGWESEVPVPENGITVWRPASAVDRNVPLGIVVRLNSVPAMLIAWVNAQQLLEDAITDGPPLTADQLVLVDGNSQFVAALTAGENRVQIPKEISGWLTRAPSELAAPLYSAPLNGKDRLTMLRPLTDIPYAITLSLPVADALLPWYRALPTYILLMLAPTLVGIGCTVFFVREAQRADRLNRALLASRHRFEMAVSAAKCGVWDWDLEGRQVYWSSAMFRLLGFTDPATVRSFEDVADQIHPADRATFQGLITDMDAASSDYDISLRLKRADGAWAWIRLKGHAVRQEHLWAKRFIGVAIDVTSERSAREKLAATEQRLRETVDSLEESFHLVDERGTTVLANRCHRQLSTLLVPEDRDLLSLKDISATQADREVKLQDGRWFQLNHQKTADGGWVQVGTDVTRLKKQERMLKDSQAVLTASVDHIKKSRAQLKQQTRELADLADRYAIEKKRAQESSRSKSEFLANMSHELRTPLNAIIGFSEMMMSEIYGALGDEKYRVYASDIFESGQRLLTMIEDILEMSRIDSGRLELVRAHLNLEEVVREVIQIVEVRATEASIRVTTDLSGLPSVFADPQAIRQVLLQLLSNAIKFTPEDGSVHVSGRFENDQVIVSVADTGIGIPQDKIERLGQPFEILEKQDAKTHAGKGLGLALARSLVELHGGTLTIESDEKSGTTVSFSLSIEQKLRPSKVDQDENRPSEEDFIEDTRTAMGGR